MDTIGISLLSCFTLLIFIIIFIAVICCIMNKKKKRNKIFVVDNGNELNTTL